MSARAAAVFHRAHPAPVRRPRRPDGVNNPADPVSIPTCRPGPRRRGQSSRSAALTRAVSNPTFGSTQGWRRRGVGKRSLSSPEAVAHMALQPDLYFISMAARLLDMHPQTLRKYERLGLVRPTRTVGAMRVYTSDELERLRLIKHLVEDAGVNLAGRATAVDDRGSGPAAAAAGARRRRPHRSPAADGQRDRAHRGDGGALIT